jgi:halocyanin-like protein
MRNDGGVTRRSVLRGVAGGTAAALSLSTVGTAGAQESTPDIDAWLSETGNYDGTVVDRTGQDAVTIDVGASGNNGNLAFGPAAVRVDPGTTVTWEWTGEGGPHNVLAEEGPADLNSGQAVPDGGTTYEHTFEQEGVTTYYCNPHKTLGMKGAVVVGDVQLGGGGVRPDFDGYLDDARNPDAVEDLRGDEEVTVQVGAGSQGLAFDPAGIWVDPGTTVKWEWTGNGGSHNVVSTEDAVADLNSGDAVNATGVEYEHTFEEGGITPYYCVPHQSLGMLGAVAVGDDVPTVAAGGGGDGDDAGDGTGGDSGFALPGGQPGVSIVLATFGITAAAVIAVLVSEYRGALAGATGAEESAWPDSEEGIEREIDHEEFDPTGTASLIALYFLILVGLWFFMYFVEFLGNGPTVIG